MATDPTPEVPRKANGEPLMAAHVICPSAVDVTWPVARIIQGDDIGLTDAVQALRVVAVQPHELPMLRTVRAAVYIRPAKAPAAGTAIRMVSVGEWELVLPEDTPCTLLHAVREATPTCLTCRRRCLHLYDAANTTSPDTAVCEECDQAVTAEVTAAVTSEKGDADGAERH